MKMVLWGGGINVNGIPLSLLPVGIIIETTDPTSPAQLYGGDWETFGAGRVLVGIDTSDNDFKTVSKEGGEKTHKLTTTEMPSHTHSISNALKFNYSASGSYRYAVVPNSLSGVPEESVVTSSVGGNSAHNNLQPYVVVYRWRKKG